MSDVKFIDIKSSFGKQKDEAGFSTIIRRKKHTETVRTGLALLRDMRICLNEQSRASKKTTKSLFLSKKRQFAVINDDVIVGYISLKRITPHLVEVSDFAMKKRSEKMSSTSYKALTRAVFENFVEKILFNYGTFDKAIYYLNTQSRQTRRLLYEMGWRKEAKLENHFMPGSNVHLFSKMLFER